MESFSLTPKQLVLVRDSVIDSWRLSIFHHKEIFSKFPFYCADACYKFCIPYIGNENLFGKNFDHMSRFKPMDGDIVVMERVGGDKRKWICKFKDLKDGRLYFYFGLDANNKLLLYDNDYDAYYHCFDNDIIRPATSVEHDIILSELREHGKTWDFAKNVTPLR